jgi:hypothetical protein
MPTPGRNIIKRVTPSFIPDLSDRRYRGRHDPRSPRCAVLDSRPHTAFESRSLVLADHHQFFALNGHSANGCLNYLGARCGADRSLLELREMATDGTIDLLRSFASSLMPLWMPQSQSSCLRSFYPEPQPTILQILRSVQFPEFASSRERPRSFLFREHRSGRRNRPDL